MVYNVEVELECDKGWFMDALVVLILTCKHDAL
jgi:hypothetical protein